MDLGDPAFTFALALTAGMIAQVAALRLRVPGIVLLLLLGVGLGPDGLDLVRPATLGSGLRVIVGAAVALILFEGGLQLELGRLRREAVTIRRLITVGALITALAATLVARLVMRWPWAVAIPFGTLVTVTGPTVIGPLLRRIRVNRNLHTILEAEAVLIDPIGAILAVVALEVVLAQELGVVARGLLGIPTRIMFGAVVGAAGGLVLARVLGSRRAVPRDLENVFTLAWVLAIYATCEAVLSESGIMAAPIAGMVVGNSTAHHSDDLKHFKEQLTVMLVGLLFVLLAADVRLSEVEALGLPGLLTVLILMAVVRPLAVAVVTAGTPLSLRERAFVGWLGPRGIVAAAVASLFADELLEAGIPEGVELRALVFLVIATTVCVQGLGGGLVARLLGVRRRSNVGWVLAGANPVGRALGRALHASGEEVLVIDTDVSEVAAARMDGLEGIVGNALDGDVLDHTDLEGRRGLISVIPNESVGLLVAEKARREFRVPSAWVAVRPGRLALVGPGLARLAGRVLFGGEADVAHWSAELAGGRAAMRRYRCVADGEVGPDAVRNGSASYLPLLSDRRGRGEPIGETVRFRRGDIVTVLVAEPDLPPPRGFEPVEEPGAQPSRGEG